MRKALLRTIMLAALATTGALAQTALPPIPAPQDVPKPGPVTRAPYAPQALMAGGIVMPLYAPDSPFLNQKRVREAEVYAMDGRVAGRVGNIVNIHNPSIEAHLASNGNNTGTAVILVPGGGHNILVAGTEGTDFVPYFYNYGVNTFILRYRLRKDGYNAKTDAVYDLQQAIRLVRAHAAEWKIDPRKIGVIGFSAGAELTSPAAIAYGEFDAKNNGANDPLAGITSRPDFVGVIYPGPTPFTRGAAPAIPKDAPPSFIASAGVTDKIHAIWATEYFTAMLNAGIPNTEMHVYARGVHGNGLSYRNFSALGTWQDRLIDWMRDLGFFQPAGTETEAAKDITAFVNAPPPAPRAPAPAPATPAARP